MTAPVTPQQFVATWKQAILKERSAAQPHFVGLCRLIGHPTPEEDDPTGERYAFEAGSARQKGGQGWADVWKKGFFAWEYKGKHANLEKAYQQLLQYRESLQNPPLLVVSDIDTIVIHNQRPVWLANAHRALDEDVFVAYGWSADLSDEAILARLLALNLERAGNQ